MENSLEETKDSSEKLPTDKGTDSEDDKSATEVKEAAMARAVNLARAQNILITKCRAQADRKRRIQACKLLKNT